jgi:hypothetical protein
MEDIDLTLDNTFTPQREVSAVDFLQRGRSGNLRLSIRPEQFGTRITRGMIQVAQVWLTENKRVKEFNDIITPWAEYEDSLDRGSFFGFHLVDPYASVWSMGVTCDRCGKPLYIWDFYSLCRHCEQSMKELADYQIRALLHIS